MDRSVGVVGRTNTRYAQTARKRKVLLVIVTTQRHPQTQIKPVQMKVLEPHYTIYIYK